ANSARRFPRHGRHARHRRLDPPHHRPDPGPHTQTHTHILQPLAAFVPTIKRSRPIHFAASLLLIAGWSVFQEAWNEPVIVCVVEKLDGCGLGAGGWADGTDAVDAAFDFLTALVLDAPTVPA